MLWYILPLGVAMALSVIPLLAAVLILLKPAPVPAGVGYLVGWTVGILGFVSLFALGSNLIISDRPRAGTPTWVHWVEIGLGSVLVLWGIWSTLRQRHIEAKTPRWTTALSSLGPIGAAGFGFAMNFRPKNLTLALGAGLAIGSASLGLFDSGVAVVIFTVVGASTVVALVLVGLLGTTRVRPALERFSGWLVAHSSTLLRISLVVVGLFLIGIGVVNLLATS